jgi:hypothetical protein
MNCTFSRLIGLAARKRNIIRAAGLTIVFAALTISGFAQYCVPQYSNGCSFGDDINSITLTGVGASTINDLNTGCGLNGYDDRTAVVPAVDLMQGSSYSGTLSTNGGFEFYKIWLDLDNNNVFDQTEALTAVIGPASFSTPGPITINIPISASVGLHRMRIRLLGGGFTPNMDPCSLISEGEAHDYLVNVVAAPACTGTPALTPVSPAGPINTCAGAAQVLTVGIAPAGGYVFQWQISTNAGASYTDIAGANNVSYGFTVSGSAFYRVYVTCTGSGGSDTSAPVSVVATAPVYTSVPFFEDFETWINNCATTDVPSNAAGLTWTNNPSAGNSSWRRDDQGFSAGWLNNFNPYNPPSISGAHSARFHTAGASGNGTPGNLDLYLDCSGTSANPALYFYMLNQSFFGLPGDNLTIQLSTNGGSSFTQIGLYDTANTWSRRYLPIISNSAQTIVRFQGNTNNNFDFDDIGLDSVYIAAPCTGIPVAGNISPGPIVAGCSGHTYVLNTLGTTMAGNLTYQWQESLDNINWNNSVSPGATAVPFTTLPLFDTIYYRLIVTCAGSGLSDTTNINTINILPPQYGNIPFFEDFENWISYCDNHDIPDGGINWTNNPSTGDNSWRRDDEGFTANWTGGFGPYFPASISGQHSARFQSAGSTPGVPGNLDLYLDCSTVPGDKELYFYMINVLSNSPQDDSLTVQLSVNGGLSFATIAGYDTATTWTRKNISIPSNSPQTIIRFQGKLINFDFNDIGVDSLYVAPPCAGSPVAGSVSPGGPISGCPGLSFTLTTTGTTLAGNLNYQWQESSDGVTWANAFGVGSTSLTFNTPQLFDTMYYRLYVVCAGSGASDTTAPVLLNIAAPQYASLPYSEGFESWMSYCSVQDVPSQYWLNNPVTGDQSWRRDDEGGTANWIFPPGGSYTPASMQGQHSARFHTFFANFGATGDLDLFVDCSAPGPKELQFHHINPSGTDELQVLLSTNGGQNFSPVTSWFNASTWTLRTATINSTSAQTVIRLRAVSDFSDDIGVDNLLVLQPCAGAPVAGTVDSLTPCSGIDFNLSLVGATLAAGITYQWQTSANGVNWTNAPGGNSSVLTDNITAAKWYRCILTCTSSGISDTTDPRKLELATFYYCYCQSGAQSNFNPDIGNVTITTFPTGLPVFSNGNPTPLTNNPTAVNTYTDFTGLTPADLFKGEAYDLSVTQIISDNSFSGGGLAVYIDYDHSGSYDLSEQVLFGTPGGVQQNYLDHFTVPTTAEPGITGMRVVMTDGPFTFPAPCTQYFAGETEDYLVNINYQPCTGALTAGLAHINDSLVCPGETLIMIDTTHEYHQSGITWVWQSSPDGVNWTDIPSTNDEDTLTITSGNANTQYRFKMLCSQTNTASYSNVIPVTIQFPYQCYCYSFANGGNADLSDIGAFSIGNFITNTGGPHLNNPSAIHGYTDNTDGSSPVSLYADSTYDLFLYHVIKNNVHQDAKVTMFIDFNNNHQYDVPLERVWTGFTNATNVSITSSVHIPADAVLNVLTGMRVILNNDVGPNIPSDEACGPYTSGETEDYAVKILDKNATHVPGIGVLGEVSIYPNPTSGQVTLELKGLPDIKKLSINVMSITGQQIIAKEFTPSSKEFVTQLDLSDKARGIYFIEIAADNERIIRKLIVR